MTEHLLHMCEELVSVPSFLLELMVLSKQMMKIKDGNITVLNSWQAQFMMYSIVQK